MLMTDLNAGRVNPLRHSSAANKIRTTMAEPKLEFTNLSRLNADSVGEPGQRTFRILADSDSSTAVLWLEKEHLYELAMGIQQLIANLPENAGTDGFISPEREAPGLTRLEFKIGKLALGHDGNNGMFLIDAYDFEDANEEAATIRIWMDREQMTDFSDEALQVCASGRPICPLCDRPIDPSGHACPRVNGHANISIE